MALVKDLKSSIRKLTDEINERLKDAIDEGVIPEQLEKFIRKLRRYGSKPSITKRDKRGRKDVIGYGFKGKKKADLEVQEEWLKTFLTADTWTPRGREIENEKARQAYESFNTNQRTDWSYDKWASFVYTLGNAPSYLLNEFGYEKRDSHKGSKTAKVAKDTGEGIDINSSNAEGTNGAVIDMFSYAYDNDIDLLTLMKEVDRQGTGKGWSQSEAIEKLMDAIKREINEQEERSNMYNK